MSWIEWVTLSIALIGATLGIFNAWWSVRRDAVRIRVRLVSLMTFPNGESTVGIEVTNLGYIPVTITEVAIRVGRFSGQRMVIASDYFRQVTLPLRMEPRTCVSVAAEPAARVEILRRGARWCSATTACGITVKRSFKVG
jgi:hypothetical protein